MILFIKQEFYFKQNYIEEEIKEYIEKNHYIRLMVDGMIKNYEIKEGEYRRYLEIEHFKIDFIKIETEE